MPVRPVQPPQFPDRFAVEWGRDEYGLFQSLAVGDAVQRLRWIPPGSFLMGSPEDEVGRFDNEVQHRVELSQGYWLADTPVTQAVWEAAMGTNPSRFKGSSNPVEMVSWDDCQEFITRLNERIEGLGARLPTEAEWEYACRAGTTTATWVGDLQAVQQIEAPLLDVIAWYHGNAGSTTHPVAQKQANPWGLYDMLGNVYEWCADRYGPYDATMLLDPCGPDGGADRVLRGGSWDCLAGRIRAARRLALLPVDRFGRLGLRIARSATP